MNRLVPIVGAVILVVVLLLAFHKKKPTLDPAVANEAVAAVNKQLPRQLGVDLTLIKASVVDAKQVRFDYQSPYPSRVQLPPRSAALMRGSMMQYTCMDAVARKIVDAGFTVDHRVTDVEGHELFDTTGDLAGCSTYKD